MTCGVKVDASEQEKSRRRGSSRVHQVAVHDDTVLGREPSRTLEAVRHLRLWGAADWLTSRVVAVASRHSPIAVCWTEGKINGWICSHSVWD